MIELPETSRAQVLRRSGRCCEAMVELPRTWARCGIAPVDVHHMLTRARGGQILDSVGEIYHLLALCRYHHSQVDNYGYESGLLISGYVSREGDRVIYTGPDDYLSTAYSELELPVVRSIFSGAKSDQGSRGAL